MLGWQYALSRHDYRCKAGYLECLCMMLCAHYQGLNPNAHGSEQPAYLSMSNFYRTCVCHLRPHACLKATDSGFMPPE